MDLSFILIVSQGPSLCFCTWVSQQMRWFSDGEVTISHPYIFSYLDSPLEVEQRQIRSRDRRHKNGGIAWINTAVLIICRVDAGAAGSGWLVTHRFKFITATVSKIYKRDCITDQRGVLP